MTTADPISLAQAQRLAANADTILLRATRSGRPRDADRRLPAPRRRRAGLPARVGRGRRAARALLVPGRRPAAVARGPRRPGPDPDPAGRRFRPTTPDLPIETSAATDPLAAIRAFVPRRRVQPTEGMPRFTGGAVGALAYDAISSFEPTVPLPERDPVGVPMAAFIETDLVLVFDHLTHTLSAIASLHTETPDLEASLPDRRGGDLRGARTDVAPERRRADRAARPRRRAPARQPTTDRPRASAGRHEPRSGRVHPRRRGREGRDRGGRGDPGRAGAPPVVRPAGATRRRARPLDGIGLYRALRRVNPSPYLFFVRTPGFEVVGASPELLLQVEGDKLTTHPIAGTRPRGADAREDALLAEELQARSRRSGPST